MEREDSPERRSRRRSPLELNIRVESEDRSYEEETRTLDVSSDGLAFLARKPLKPDQVLEVSVELPSPVRDRQLRFVATGRIIYCRPRGDQWAVGFRFYQPPEMQIPD